jgi:hypothetical protein
MTFTQAVPLLILCRPNLPISQRFPCLNLGIYVDNAKPVF